MADQYMPIMRTSERIPFSVLCEEWAQRNHGQSLARLAERGGLDSTEALAIIEKRRWHKMESGDALRAVLNHVAARTKPAVSVAVLDQPKGRIDCRQCNGAGVVRGHLDDCFSALCTLNGDVHSCPGEVRPCACTKPLNGIRATMFHDEGAIAQCGHCKRYTLDRKALSDRQPTCTCGQKHGWSGAFVKPGPDAQWHGPAPSSGGQRDA